MEGSFIDLNRFPAGGQTEGCVMAPRGLDRGTPRRSPARKRHSFRPAVEALEPRRTPAVSFDVQQDVANGNVHSLETADFNGDGKLDVAFADWGLKFFVNPSVGVLLNTTPAGVSAPSFAAAQTF